MQRMSTHFSTAFQAAVTKALGFQHLLSRLPTIVWSHRCNKFFQYSWESQDYQTFLTP